MKSHAALTLMLAFGVSACGANEPAEPIESGVDFIRATIAKACEIEPATVQLACSDEQFYDRGNSADIYVQDCNYGFIEGADNHYGFRAQRSSGDRNWGATTENLFSVTCTDGKPISTATSSGQAMADRPNADTLNAELAPTARNGNPAPTVTAMQCRSMTDNVYEYCCDVTFDSDEAFRASGDGGFQTFAFYRSPIDNSWLSKVAQPNCGASNASNQQQIIPLN